jgi:hypothetical protein
MCTRARPYGRVGWCGFGGRGVTSSLARLEGLGGRNNAPSKVSYETSATVVSTSTR